ncbi:MAG: tetratricopeptide repeat protein [Polaribacter sp.]
MKTNFYYFIFLFLLMSCVSEKNSPEFIEKTTGRYLFNANEIIEIYFKESVLYAKWRGKDDIKPLKINDSSFYFKEINEKLIFISSPKTHIQLAEKREHEGVKYEFKKMKKGDKTPKEYFDSNQFDKALNSFLLIQKNDSLNAVIRESRLNRMGYNYLRENEFKKAIEIFKINVALYPKSSNVYDSLGDAYLSNKDTVKAVENYQKSLVFNNKNRNAIKALKKISKK